MHEFRQEIVRMLPQMRGWAISMTRDKTAAEDLVQEVVAKALGASQSFEPGSNLAAWLRRIMRNHFISTMRSRRDSCDIDEVANLATEESQDDRTELKEMFTAFSRLSAEQQEVMSLIILQEHSYEEVAAKTGTPIGTLKSRLHRARDQLRQYVDGPTQAAE